MISSVVSSSSLLQISIGSNQVPLINPNALSSGQIRYNPNNRKIEILDGSSNSWNEYQGEFVSIGFSLDIEETLNWAKEQMRKEREWIRLAENNQSIKNALENYQQSKLNLEVLSHLTKDIK
jgi:hypothetical protein